MFLRKPASKLQSEHLEISVFYVLLSVLLTGLSWAGQQILLDLETF